ncbi:MAG: hypothetical protein MJZ54_02520, partial [Bacteroidaceae bacterium]|nr:hypothetical protein [Bacteroidaceae bacterium]
SSANLSQPKLPEMLKSRPYLLKNKPKSQVNGLNGTAIANVYCARPKVLRGLPQDRKDDLLSVNV